MEIGGIFLIYVLLFLCFIVNLGYDGYFGDVCFGGGFGFFVIEEKE